MALPPEVQASLVDIAWDTVKMSRGTLHSKIQDKRGLNEIEINEMLNQFEAHYKALCGAIAE